MKKNKKSRDKFNALLIFTLFAFLFLSVDAFALPVVTNINPLYGPATGGQTVTITGTGFTGATQVYFGTLPAASFSVSSSTVITAASPILTTAGKAVVQGTPGVVDITVVTSSGTSAANQNDRYAFTGDWIVFAPDFGTAQVYCIDAATKYLYPLTIGVGNGPNDVVINSTGTTAYCVNSEDSTISIIDVGSQSVTGTVSVDQSFPILMAITQDPTSLHEIGYTTNYQSNTVSQVDLTAQTILKTANAGSSPTGGIVSSATGGVNAIAYVTNTGSSSISRIDFSTTTPAVTTISTNVGSETGSVPSFIALAPDGTTAYFTDDNPSQYAVKQLLNVNTTSPTVGHVITDASLNFSFPSLFPQLGISPPNSAGNIFGYVTNTGNSTESEAVTMMNLTNVSSPSVTCTLTGGFGPNGLAVTPDGTQIYVCNASNSDEVSITTGLNPPSCTAATTNQLVGDTPTDPTVTPDQALLANFSVNPAAAKVSQTITFNASSSVSPVGGISTYTWNFGDGTSPVTSSSATTTHSYSTIGTYTATLTVTNTAGTSLSSSSYFNGQFYLRNGQPIGSGQSAQFTQSITIAASGLASSSTALTSSLNPSTCGSSVTFTATVTGSSGTPTGTVSFYENGTILLGTGTLNGSGVTSISTTALTEGSPVTISAVYSGNGTYTSSTGILSQTVNPAATTTTIISMTPNPSNYGQTVTFAAQVTTTTGTLNGTVNFYDTSATPNTLFGSTPLSSGTAAITYSGFEGGTHVIEAMYIPSPTLDACHASSSGTASLVVNPDSTSTTVVTVKSPITYGQQATFNATVTFPSGIPSGGGTVTSDFVSFYDGSIFLGSSQITGYSGNQAFTSFTTTTNLTPGIHAITAAFNDSNSPSPDPNYSTSSGTAQQAVQQTTTTTVASSLNPSVYGQNVTFTATVNATSPTDGPPTGIVSFYDGTFFLGTGTLTASGASQSTATYTTTSYQLLNGPHAITAVYGGDTIYLTSTSPPLTQIVTLDPRCLQCSFIPPLLLDNVRAIFQNLYLRLN